jgi:septal ring factor EnvC (AmiA/AmiB activator)
MRYLIIGLLFAGVAIITFGCTTAPVQQQQDIWTKFPENSIKNQTDTKAKLETMAKEQAELIDKVDKLEKKVIDKVDKLDKKIDDMKLIDLKELQDIIDKTKMILTAGRTTKEQGQ